MANTAVDMNLLLRRSPDMSSDFSRDYNYNDTTTTLAVIEKLAFWTNAVDVLNSGGIDKTKPPSDKVYVRASDGSAILVFNTKAANGKSWTSIGKLTETALT